MKKLTLSEFLYETLILYNTKFIFGIPGSHVLPLYNELRKQHKISLIDVYHENTASYMASMYGYLEGNPGVCLVTAGPGATNAATGVAHAFSSSIPMIVITGGVPTNGMNESFHGNDSNLFLSNLFQTITKKSFRIENVRQFDKILLNAFKIALSGRKGPVHIEIPIDIQSDNNAIFRTPSALSEIPSSYLDKSYLLKIVKSLENAKRPMICVGRGVILDSANSELVTLSNLLFAPVLSSIYALGSIPTESILNVGIFSEYIENKFAFDLIKESDCVLIIGMRSGTKMIDVLSEYLPKKTFFIALDEKNTIKNLKCAEFTELSNSKYALNEILRHKDIIKKNKNLELNRKLIQKKSIFNRGLDNLMNKYDKEKPLHYGLVLRRLLPYLEDDCIACSGVGNHNIWARIIHPIKYKNSFIAEASWGSMGSEIANAICAKLLNPSKQVISYTGDGSAIMVASDIATAVQAKANIIIIILNDTCYGIISGLQKQHFKETIGDKLPKINFSKLAESMGAIGLILEKQENIDVVLEKAFNYVKTNTVVIDISCTNNILLPTEKNINKMAEKIF